MRFRSVGFVFVASVFLATGCGDDNSADPGETFTDAEATEVFSALDEIMNMFALFNGPGTVGVASGIAAQSTPVNESHTCPGGGSASITGTSTETNTTLDGNITVSISSCVVRNGHATIDGGFSLVATGRLTGTTQFTITLVAEGDLDATLSSGRERTCHIDYTQTNVLNTTTGGETESKSGTICGRSASGIDP